MATEIKQRKAVVTVVSGPKYERIWAKTWPRFEAYAARTGSKLVVIGHQEGIPSQHWAKLGIYELLRKRFHRVAYIDADVLIREDCPDLFDVVPDNAIGIFNEGRYSPRAICIYEIMNAYRISLPKWNRIDYYNTGVMVVSREHRHLFKLPGEVKRIRNSYGEQTWLNLQILQSGVQVHELHHSFNHMSLMDRLTGTSRKAAYIIHYAGPPSEEALHAALDDDLEAWGRKDYCHVPNLFINIGGGLGDQVCAEPVIRYIREELYPEANIFAATAYPRLFKHIDGVHFSDKLPDVKLDAVHSMDTHPDEKTPHSQYVNYSHTHQVNYISTAVIKRELPILNRTIKLTWGDDDEAEVLSICESPRKLVLVHAGKGWPSKTFPVNWWQSVVDRLAAEGYRVGLIGKEIGGEHSFQPVHTDGWDFRDRLSLGGLIYLLSQAPLLITNDSGPLHLAGAFDNFIILIPTCKHPDYILPWRNGSPYYRTSVLYKRLLCEAIKYRPTDVMAMNPRDLAGDILDYLPSPEKVVENVIQNQLVNFLLGLQPDQPIAAKGRTL